MRYNTIQYNVVDLINVGFTEVVPIIQYNVVVDLINVGFTEVVPTIQYNTTLLFIYINPFGNYRYPCFLTTCGQTFS